MTVEGVSRHWTALSRGPFLQHPPWSEDWHVAAPSSKANILSYGPRLSGRLEYLVQVGQQGSWSLGAVAWCSAKKWDERFPGYAAHAELLAQARGPAQPAVVAPNRVPEQVVQLINQQYQRVTGGAQLPGKALKGDAAKALADLTVGVPEAAWMRTVRSAIQEVGLEATVAFVSSNPLIIFSSPVLLAEQLREYGLFTGWGRKKVLLWLLKSGSSKLLPRTPGDIINTARDYASHAGLSEQEMLRLLDTSPAAFAHDTAHLRAGWSALHALQATHPSWAEQWGGYSHQVRLRLSGHPPYQLHFLCFLVSTGQQAELGMRSAVEMSLQRFTAKFPAYVPPWMKG